MDRDDEIDRIPLTFADGRDVDEYLLETPYMGDIENRAKKTRTLKPYFIGLSLILGLLLIIVLSVHGDVPDQGSVEPALPMINGTQLASYFHSPSQRVKYEWFNVQGRDGLYLRYTHLNMELHHVRDGFVSTIFLGKDVPIDTPSDWKLSADLKYAILGTEYEKGWRNSHYSNYFLFQVDTKTMRPLSTSTPGPPIPGTLGSGKQSMILLSPVGHTLAWVRDNDLYLTVNASTEIRVTTDGSINIMSGISDWVYEEEILSTNIAAWFSTLGSRLAYVQFNDTLVEEYHLQYYMKFGNTSYPSTVDLKYPKPGTPNPTISIFVASGFAHSNLTLVRVDFQDPAFEAQAILTQLTWVDDDRFLVRLRNRVQDAQRIYLVQWQSNVWKVVLVRNESNADGAWYSKAQPLVLVPPSPFRSEPTYVEMMNDVDGYMHIAYYANVSSSLPALFLTNGAWDVASIESVDPISSTIYFMSTFLGSTEQHLSKVRLDGSDLEDLTPLWNNSIPFLVPTINKTRERPNRGLYSVSFSALAGYYHLSYLGPDIPWEAVYSTNSTWTRNIYREDRLASAMTKYSFPKIQYFTIPNSVDMNAKMIVPANFDGSGKKKYALFMKTYGGPDSQQVKQGLEIDFLYKMASNGMVVLVVDGRGTGLKGRKYLTSVSKNLGKVEAEDQITAAKWMGQQSFIDPSRIALWGWSFGGFLTAKVIEADSGVFAAAISVAPVIDWSFYDTMYTERYMKTPQENFEGYQSSAITQTKGFKNVKFLLAHGTGDDNVHIQNSAKLIWELTRDEIHNYTSRLFTDSEHSLGLNGADTQLYYFLESFLCTELKVDCVEE